MSDQRPRDSSRHISHAHTVARRAQAQGGLPPLPKAGPMAPIGGRGGARMKEPEIRAPGTATPRQPAPAAKAIVGAAAPAPVVAAPAPVVAAPAPAPVANVIPLRPPTAKPHLAAQNAAARDWLPDRTEPTPRRTGNLAVALEPMIEPVTVPTPPPAMAPAPPQEIVAEGSRPVSWEPAPAARPARRSSRGEHVARNSNEASIVVAPDPLAAFHGHVPVATPTAGLPTVVPKGPTVHPWAIYEKLGLGPKDLKRQSASQLLVQTYRALGFAILSIIVFVLVGYIATTAFYFWNSSWIEPIVVTPTDERVLALQAQVAQQENERDRLAAELTAADQEIAVNQDFQGQFAAAIRADLDGRKAELARARGLADRYAGARAKIERSNSAYAAASATRMSQEFKAGLIDRSDMLSGKYQLAQITTSNLGLAEREAEYETRAQELDAQARALEALLADQHGPGALSYDVLKIKQEYEASRLATARATATRDAIKAAKGRVDAILDELRHAPQLRALTDHATVAFIPYGNLAGVAKGTPVYGCAMEMLWCHQVGEVQEVLPGEVQFKHPRREKMLRGQMVELRIDADDAEQAKKDVLFVGSRPMWL